MDCIFCKIIKGEIPSYTIYEDEYVKCFLDINPNTDAHTLIVPKKHFVDAYDIEDEYLIKIEEAARKVMDLIKDNLHATGFKLAVYNGVLQDVKHYHLHVIPNYNKNTLRKVEDVYNLLTK